MYEKFYIFVCTIKNLPQLNDSNATNWLKMRIRSETKDSSWFNVCMYVYVYINSKAWLPHTHTYTQCTYIKININRFSFSCMWMYTCVLSLFYLRSYTYTYIHTHTHIQEMIMMIITHIQTQPSFMNDIVCLFSVSFEFSNFCYLFHRWRDK